MESLPVIHLDTDWRYYPIEDMEADFGVSELDESTWGVLENLEDYPQELVTFYGTLNLRRRFDLPAIDEICVRYKLHVATAPEGTQVYVNGWHVGTGQALVADVTDFVMLEDNLLLLKLSRKGQLGSVWLQAVPCE